MTAPKEGSRPSPGLDSLRQLGKNFLRGLRSLYGEEPQIFSGKHHARYIRADTVYHVASQVFQGRFLLVPCKELNDIIAGVLGRAQEQFKDVKLYAYAFLSNHFHLQLQGPPEQLVAFVGYVKREISRRWGGHPAINWPGTMWEESFFATALPTEESQLRCFKYILSQGVKEGLVATPRSWPGIHCAKQLVGKTPLRGTWFNGTAYGRAKDANSRRKPKNQLAVRRIDYVESYTVRVDTLPIWRGLEDTVRNRTIRSIEGEVIADGERMRGERGIRPLGAKAVMATSRETRTKSIRLPWFENRRRMICWADPSDPRVIEYNKDYRYFQGDFRAAARDRKLGIQTPFPLGSFSPGGFVALAA